MCNFLFVCQHCLAIVLEYNKIQIFTKWNFHIKINITMWDFSQDVNLKMNTSKQTTWGRLVMEGVKGS